ncbi:MAG: hypothetical protein ACKVP7_25550 [Hyphomicrobiaceae bacterium]
MLAEIGEDEATGEIAAIFAEVRELWGVPYVSAIQRHLATRPGVLEWAWEAVAPAFRSGAAQMAGERAAAGVNLPPLPAIPRDALGVWGVDTHGLATIRAIADGFVRVAPTNMMFAGLVKALLAGAAPGGATSPASGRWAKPAPLPAPPAMLAPEKLDAATRGTLMQFATPSDGKPFVPGLYRMLAHWPGYLAHLATVLPPRLTEPATVAAFDQIRSRIDAAVPEVLATLPRDATARPMPVASEREHFLTIGGTYRKTSPELIVLGRLISDALPR